jgi:hypothetical protein
MSFASAKTAFEEAAAAFRDRDYTTAIDRLLEAQAYLAAVPDSKSNQGVMLTFRQDVANLLAAARERERTVNMRNAGGIQRAPITYVNPGCESD